MWDDARARRARCAVRSKRARIRIDAREDRIGASVRRLFDELTALAVPAGDRHTVELALCEIVATVRRTSFRAKADGTIVLSAGPGPRGLYCQLIDDGRPMPVGRDAPSVPLAFSVQDTSEDADDGFGWLVIESLARDLRYRPRYGMNVLSFRMPIQSFATERVF